MNMCLLSVPRPLREVNTNDPLVWAMAQTSLIDIHSQGIWPSMGRQAHTRRHRRRSSSPETRSERKQRTREALLDASLRLLDDRAFGSLSLREVTREAGIVPAGFYRHFEDMDELGFALVDESFRRLRQMLRGVREDRRDYKGVIRASVGILVRHVHDNRLHFRFIARERSSGVPALRRAIRAEIRLFTSELATDLARFPDLRTWSSEDLQMIAALMVNTMVATVEAMLDAPAEDPLAEQEVILTAERQLRLIVLAIPNWRGADGAGAGGAGASVAGVAAARKHGRSAPREASER
jgi:AcrR family transcriptional regulator